MKTFFKYLLLSFLLILLFIDCSKKDTSNLVDVNGFSINKTTFINRFKLSKNYKENDIITPEIITTFLETFMIDNLLFMAEAEDTRLDQEPEFITSMNDIQKGIITQSNGVLFNHIIPSQFPASDEEINDFYNGLNVEIKIANITVNSKKRAELIYKELINGGDFSKLSATYSHDLKTVQNDGIMDIYFTKGMFDPKLDEVAFTLKIDEIAKPFATQYGYQIIKLIDKKEKELPEFEKARDNIIKEIKTKKLLTYIDNYNKSLVNKYKLGIKSELIQKILDNSIMEKGKWKIDLSNFSDNEQVSQFVTYNGGQMNFGDFCKAYNDGWKYFPLNDTEDIVSIVENIVQKDIMYLEALNLGLDQDEKLVKTMEKYRNDRLKRFAMQKMIYDKVLVTEEMVKNEFMKSNKKFDQNKFDKVKNGITSKLRSEKVKNIKNELTTRLQKKYKIKYNQYAVKSMVEELNLAKTEGK